MPILIDLPGKYSDIERILLTPCIRALTIVASVLSLSTIIISKSVKVCAEIAERHFAIHFSSFLVLMIIATVGVEDATILPTGNKEILKGAINCES